MYLLLSTYPPYVFLRVSISSSNSGTARIGVWNLTSSGICFGG